MIFCNLKYDIKRCCHILKVRMWIYHNLDRLTLSISAVCRMLFWASTVSLHGVLVDLAILHDHHEVLFGISDELNNIDTRIAISKQQISNSTLICGITPFIRP